MFTQFDQQPCASRSDGEVTTVHAALATAARAETRVSAGAIRAAMRAFVRATWAGLLLGLVAFGIGFGFGILRVVFVTPVLGPLGAVLLELMVLLPLLWWTAGRVCQRMAIGSRDARFMVGLTALATLLSLEAGFAVAAIKISFSDYIEGIVSPAGLIGLAGQAMLAWLPALHAETNAKDPKRASQQTKGANTSREWSWPRFQH